MRTTLTLDDDLAERLKEAAHQERRPFRDIVNDAIRRGLGGREKPRKQRAFVLRTYRSRLKSGIDEARLNQLVDQLDADEFINGSLKR